MRKKGMRPIFFKQSPAASPLASPPSRHTFSKALMDEKLENAQFLISKWDSSESSSYCNISSLFSAQNRPESKQYLNSIKQLQSVMQYYISENPTSEKLVQGQRLMQTAMKRLEKEFYRILKSSRRHLDPESVSSRSSRSSVSDFEEESEDDSSSTKLGDEVSEVERASMVAMSDLKSIADCMIGSGYGIECVKIYKIIRKSIVDEALYHLGVERLTLAQIQKMEWEALELKIKQWLNAVKIAVKTLFYGERILCDHVFSASLSVTESCFMNITREAASTLFGFPENVSKSKKAPEKMFRTLDLYETITDLRPDIEAIFSFQSSSAIRTQVDNSMVKLREAVLIMLTDFETAISKDNSKSVPGGGIHPLTRYVMNYTAFLADYNGPLTDIVADWPLNVPSPLPGSYFGSPESDDYVMSAFSARFAWLILVLLCKLDGKAELYNDVALSYLFLANNLQYVVNKVCTSSLKFLLGDEWVTKHIAKVRQYAANYERMGWSRVMAALPQNAAVAIPVNEAKGSFIRFNTAFEEAYKKQSSWVVKDSKLRDEIKISVARKIVPVYREFYEKYRLQIRREMGSDLIVRFAPEDLENYLSDLLNATGGGGSVSSTSSSSSFSSRDGRRR
ncbi:hypothetical protein K2173_023734 [Erythroxylum novogranatense]|uniref:Exocyst subunit Exo70 family protein n=1 Tax=Erythroxylum novogranatense TaxID=1862640 RepID=A0AAV8TRF0_9ROSI|nr:hypothetical protein K2173_023734 [Erythroxylum novogranatense]